MLELRVLGSLDLVRDDGTAVRSVLAQPKRTALLVYLAVAHPGEYQHRDTLLAAFWPERDRSHARNALNQSLHFLRRSLSPGVIKTRGREEVGLAEDALWCDAVALQEAIEAEEWERALELYRGDLLEGFHVSGVPAFERWMDRERTRLREAARDAAVERAGDAATAGEARRWLLRALEIAPTDERAVRRLMARLDDAGDRAGALRAYEVLVTRLERTLGTEPSPETQALADDIREREEAHGPASARSDRPGEVENGEAEREGGKEEDAASPPAPSAGVGAGIGRLRRLSAAAATAVLLAGLALVAALRDSGGPAADPSPGERAGPSVAVLPFEELSADAGDRRLADGVTEDLITTLARMGGLPVTSRTSVMTYRDRPADAADVARELGVTHLVEGAVRRSGDRVVITAQLIDARTDRHLWARTYDRRAVDLLDLQRDVARAIAQELPAEISPAAAERAGSPSTTDARAYEFFLRGREYQTRRSGDPGKNHRNALRMFRRATERDPGFAEAWARAAASHLGLFQWSAERAEERVERARAAAERALAADPDGPWGHWALADLHYRGTRDEEAALQHLEAAKAAGLTTGEVLAREAAVLRRLGRLEEAAALFERARALDPLNEGLIFQSFFVHLGLRRYGKAEEVLERVLELAPDHHIARRYRSRLPLLRDGDADAVGPPASREWETLWRRGDFAAALAVEGPPFLPGHEGRTRARRGLVYRETGDSAAARAAFDSARAMLEETVRRDSFTMALSWLGVARAGLGERETALRAARRAVELAERDRGPASVSVRRFYLALVQILAGDEEAAFGTLERYLAEPGARSFRNVATHPLVAPLLDRPDFRKLERRFGGR